MFLEKIFFQRKFSLSFINFNFNLSFYLFKSKRIQTTKISALTLFHNVIASKMLIWETTIKTIDKIDRESRIKLEESTKSKLEILWKIVYNIAFNNNDQDYSDGSRSSDTMLEELNIEIREEAINVAREFISNFNKGFYNWKTCILCILI